MSRSSFIVKEFVDFVKVCEQTINLEHIITMFGDGDTDRLVVVNTEQYPLGVIYFRSLMPLVVRHPLADINLQQPLSQLELSIIQPVVTVSSEITGDEFWAEWKQSLIAEIPIDWALIDTEGKFLGLLNLKRLLIALKMTREDRNTSVVHKSALTQQDNQVFAPPTLHLLAEFLEQIPLPMRLQTMEGKIFVENTAWQQNIGELAAYSLDMSVSASMPTKIGYTGSNFYASQTAVLNNLGNLTHRPLELISISEGKVESPLILQEQHSYHNTNNSSFSVAENTKNEQERLWQFMKVSLGDLSLALSGLEKSQFEHSPLLLIWAQDVTEQQQVAKELAAKNADLIQLNRLKDEFLACISHELKTPLTAVLGLSSLLKDHLLGTLNERQTRYAKLIHQSGKQLMSVVNDILDLTRMETGQMQLTLDIVNIPNVCDRAYNQAKQRANSKNNLPEDAALEKKFTLNIETGLEMLIADEARLRQMLFNLLSNALKFTNLGGEIGLNVSRWDGWIAFTVWDTGIGIPNNKQHLIFQKFQQLENPLTRTFEGTGLGLVLTQRLARLHGGDVSFISKIGEGSQFTLLLPPIPPQAKHLEFKSEEWQRETEAKEIHFPLPIPSLQSQSNQLILIVEAVPQYIEELTSHLTNLNYRVMIARSGTEALEKARRLQPGVIFLNPLLPQLSGWDVLILLKADNQTKHIPVVVTATQAEKSLAYQNRADKFLTIPVKHKVLQEILTDLMQVPTVDIGTRLTILHLTSELPYLDTREFSKMRLKVSDFHLNYRIIEVDDLEQAEMLARIWHPNVILLDGTYLEDPFTYLQKLSHLSSLASLPLVTIDLLTTQAANQVGGLSVFPCLIPPQTNYTIILSQVLKVAAGMGNKPSILVLDIATVANLSEKLTDITLSNINLELNDNLEKSEVSEIAYSTNNITSKILNLKSINDWLQALVQYLQMAGFRSMRGESLSQIYQQIKNQSIDLMLIHLGDILPEEELINALNLLINITPLPLIMVLYHRGNNSQIQPTPIQMQSNSQLETILNNMAAKIIRQPPESMTELLFQINELLAQNRQGNGE